MRSLALALAALALAAALVVPASEVLAPGLRSLHEDLRDGSFKPLDGRGFEPSSGATPFSDRAGGVSGDSPGNFLPQAGALPDRWAMDRDGSGGEVTIDLVFDPALGAMKRLKAYDTIGPGYVLSVADPALRAPTELRGVRYDVTFRGGFPVALEPGAATPVYSPDAAAVPVSWETVPAVPGGVAFFKDGADTFYVRARDPGYRGVVNVSVLYRATTGYFELTVPEGLTVGAYGAAAPQLDPDIRAKAARVLAAVGLEGERRVDRIVPRLVEYFSAFGEGDIPPPTEYRDLYEAIAYGQEGCCRHRAFGFAVTAQAAGVPARVVANEAHAFVEVLVPGQGWRQQNLGGCGDYRINNPAGHRAYHADATDPRTAAPGPGPGALGPAVATTTTLDSWPETVRKGTPFVVRGRVVDASGAGVGGADVDLFVNATKETPGVLVGRGRTDPNGAFSLRGDIPREAPARGYQLVAHAHDGADASGAWKGSWSDPEIHVESGTRFELDVPRVDGVGVEVPVRGRLVDDLGGPAPDARIELRVDGAAFGAASTAEDGSFLFLVVFHARGEHALRFAFAGDRYRDPSTADARISVEDTTLDVPRSLVAVRGEEAELAGRVLRGGVGLSGRTVAVVFPFDADAAEGASALPRGGFAVTTGPDGAFRLAFTPRLASAPGAHVLGVFDAELGLARNVSLRLDVRTTLEVSASTADGNTTILGRLVDDAGAPLAGETVSLSSGGVSVDAVTDARGTASLALGPLPAGRHSARAAFGGREAFLASSDEASFSLGGVGDLPPGAAAAALASVAAAALAAWGWRHAGLGARVAAWRAAVRERSATRLAVSFPGNEPGGRPVVAPGQPFAVRVVARRPDGAPVARGHVVLTVAGARLRVDTDADGAALARLPGRPTGTVEVVAAHGGGRTVARLRVAEYRRALEEEWLDLVDEAAQAGIGVDRTTCPREAEAALATLGLDPRTLDRLVGLAEVASFSERPVDRQDLAAFVVAAAPIRHALAREAPIGV